MPNFGRKSKHKLATCHPDLQYLFEVVVEEFDCTILEGHRSEERQEKLYKEGKSKLKKGGRHNESPSEAVDVAPYPIDWEDTKRFCYFAGYVKGIAKVHGIPIRWGGDWDGDTEVRDNKFNDLVHFELDD